MANKKQELIALPCSDGKLRFWVRPQDILSVENAPHNDNECIIELRGGSEMHRLSLSAENLVKKLNKVR